jgi:hypothetical protein
MGEFMNNTGFINGYRWGVEYPTNGSKPNLPDDVIIQLSAPMCRGALSVFSSMYAAKGATFKIIDERYKPEDASYLDEYFAVQGIDQQKIKNTLISDIAEQGWYDYTNQKSLRLPPVGVECETFWPLDSEPQWYHATVMYASGKNVVLNFKNAEEVSYKRQSLDSDGVLFRPLDYNRKAEMERENTIDHLYYKYPNEVDEGGMALLELLYDAGFLRMPEDK